MQNKYYINEVRLKESNWKVSCIGLFKPLSDELEWHGEGNCCGWYGAEYYDNVQLLAYYTIENLHMYSPKGHNHIEEHNSIFKEYLKIQIGSCYWGKTLEAENDLEAIQKFLKEEFE